MPATAIKLIVDRVSRRQSGKQSSRFIKGPGRAIDPHTLRGAINAADTSGHNNRVDVPRALIPSRGGWRRAGWLPGRKEGELESDVAGAPIKARSRV